MVGHVVADVLSRAGGIVVEGTDRRPSTLSWFFDAREGATSLRALWRRGGYEYVVNCIGLTKAAIDETDPASVETAIRVNAVLPHELASLAVEFGARVLHISTDGVFSGSLGPYAEDAPHDCTAPAASDVPQYWQFPVGSTLRGMP
jgi:dTDP-4-dehydrorhamnose reductase